MNSNDELFAEWDLYDRISRADYMRQEEISAAIREALRQHPLPSRVIDLGCGDGRLSRKVLANSHVSEFTGIDLSQSAISRHEQAPSPGIAPNLVRRSLLCGDIGEELATLPDQSLDVVHASFSLHHYPSEAKPAVLGEIARVLAPGGWLIWTDTVRHEDESRARFLSRLAQVIDTQWLAITPEERSSVIAHINEYDFPETYSWMVDQLKTLGLSFQVQPFRDDFFGTFVFLKP